MRFSQVEADRVPRHSEDDFVFLEKFGQSYQDEIISKNRKEKDYHNVSRSQSPKKH